VTLRLGEASPAGGKCFQGQRHRVRRPSEEKDQREPCGLAERPKVVWFPSLTMGGRRDGYLDRQRQAIEARFV
jgi:hypothetical protein